MRACDCPSGRRNWSAPPGLFPAAKAILSPLTSRGAGATGSLVKATLVTYDRTSHSHANGSFPCADFWSPSPSTGEIRLTVQAEEERTMEAGGAQHVSLGTSLLSDTRTKSS